MSSFFHKPKPQQAVPNDLNATRDAIINAILGGGGGAGGLGGYVAGGGTNGMRPGGSQYRPGANGIYPGMGIGQGPQQYLNGMGGGGRQGGVLGALLGLINDKTPGGDILGPLKASADQRLGDQINASNADSPGRFSTAQAYQNSQLTERSQNDFNLLSAQVLQQGRDRQLQAIMALLGPVLGPTFGGPFTQNASGFDNFLGLLSAGGSFLPGSRGGSNK